MSFITPSLLTFMAEVTGHEIGVLVTGSTTPVVTGGQLDADTASDFVGWSVAVCTDVGWFEGRFIRVSDDHRTAVLKVAAGGELHFALNEVCGWVAGDSPALVPHFAASQTS